MKMVAHQNKTQNRRLKTLRRYAQQLEKARVIALVMKNCLSCVASCAEMIDGSSNSTRTGRAIPPA
jgi:hypothetical protein